MWFPRASLSRASQLQAFQGHRRSSSNPVGTHGGFGGAAGQAWGLAQQCSVLLHSTVVGSPGESPFCRSQLENPKSSQPSRSGGEMLLGLGEHTPLPRGMTNEYCCCWWQGVHPGWLLCAPGALQLSRQDAFLGHTRNVFWGGCRTSRVKPRGKEGKRAPGIGDSSSAALTLGRTGAGRDAQWIGDFLTLAPWGWGHPRLN